MPGAKQSRREVLLVAAATGVALMPGCHGPTPTESPRRIPMKETFVPDAPTATPKVAKTKFENDRVRVLEFISEPGDKEALHSHPAFVVYVVTGGTLRVTSPDGTSIDDEFKDGDIRYREPRIHTTENIGKTRLHAIIVELKTT
jgi:quercetin dioxygenase-like cupin family protein